MTDQETTRTPQGNRFPPMFTLEETLKMGLIANPVNDQ